MIIVIVVVIGKANEGLKFVLDSCGERHSGLRDRCACGKLTQAALRGAVVDNRVAGSSPRRSHHLLTLRVSDTARKSSR